MLDMNIECLGGDIVMIASITDNKVTAGTISFRLGESKKTGAEVGATIFQFNAAPTTILIIHSPKGADMRDWSRLEELVKGDLDVGQISEDRINREEYKVVVAIAIMIISAISGFIGINSASSTIISLEKNPDRKGNPHKDRLAISIVVIVMGSGADMFPISRMSWVWAYR